MPSNFAAQSLPGLHQYDAAGTGPNSPRHCQVLGCYLAGNRAALRAATFITAQLPYCL